MMLYPRRTARAQHRPVSVRRPRPSGQQSHREVVEEPPLSELGPGNDPVSSMTAVILHDHAPASPPGAAPDPRDT
jgi:hypothetical protein